MLNPTEAPLRPRVLVVDYELAKLDTALGRSAESLAAALEARNLDVIRAIVKARMHRRPRCYTSCASGMRRRTFFSSRTANAPGEP